MKRDLGALKRILPAFPRTAHVPYQPNLEEGDIVAAASDVSCVFTETICIEEKIDAASVGMTLYKGESVVRNREHILTKGYFKDTAAKKQFASLWTYFYENKGVLETLDQLGPYSLYGEWCRAAHGILYTRLPSWFIPYDIYNYETGTFLPSPQVRKILAELRLDAPRLHHMGLYDGNYEELTALANLPAEWTDDKAEGIYIKVYNNTQVTARFKMVRSDFERGKYWDVKTITQNQMVK